MKKITISLILTIFSVLLLTSLASAQIVINQQPKELYNLGEVINIPVKIVASTEIDNFFFMHFICNGKIIEINKNPLYLSVGEEKQQIYTTPLTKTFIGNSIGKCKIKFSVEGETPEFTNDFGISNKIDIHLSIEQTEFNPGESILISGEAVKKNGDVVNGFLALEGISQNSYVSENISNTSDETSESIEQLGIIDDGFFSINLSLSEEMQAGTYTIKVTAYEKDSNGEKTNQGQTDYNVFIRQIPTSLEILFENSEVEPGTNLKVKTILHDQTGEKIETISIITIKDKNNVILEQVEKPTDEFLEFPITYHEAPSEWSVVAVSKRLTNEATFTIIEKEDVKVDIINKTIVLTNMGNIPYSENVLVKIGNDSVNINASLEVDEIQKYVLTAPDGEYNVEILGVSKNVMLTGKVVNVKMASSGVLTLVRYPIVWIFIMAILGFVAFMFFKKGYKRTFIGYIRKRFKRKKASEKSTSKGNSIVNMKNKAELSLSIKGEKQNISLMCIKIKNLEDLKSSKSSEEILQKITNIAEEKKAVIYENQDNLFFILAPAKTKTFKNEKTTVEIAQATEQVIKKYNKLAKNPIEFGIALNYGVMIIKQETNILKFMSMGTLITTAKKLATISNEEILLAEKIKDKLVSDIKTSKHTKGNVIYYIIKEIKKGSRPENKKFIKDFLNRMDAKR